MTRLKARILEFLGLRDRYYAFPIGGDVDGNKVTILKVSFRCIGPVWHEEAE